MWVDPVGIKRTGTSHYSSGKPCEDNFDVASSKDGLWKVLVVSDGAGSAKKAIEGSEIVSRQICECLLNIAELLKNQPPGAWINDHIIGEMLFIRQTLRERAKSDNISDYHSTLVAALIGPHGGVSIHIGDGIIIGGRTKIKTVEEIILNDQFFYSEPENGEYANETFFITEKDWVKHLRIRTFSKLDWLIVASDGGASYFQNGNSTFNNSNIQTLLKQITLTKNNSIRPVLEDFIDDPQFDEITSDDKTILISFDTDAFINKFEHFTFYEKPGDKLTTSISRDTFSPIPAIESGSRDTFKLFEILISVKDKEILLAIGSVIFIFILVAFGAILYLLYGMNENSKPSILKSNIIDERILKEPSTSNKQNLGSNNPRINPTDPVNLINHAGSFSESPESPASFKYFGDTNDVLSNQSRNHAGEH